jgi:hypothetical protein
MMNSTLRGNLVPPFCCASVTVAARAAHKTNNNVFMVMQGLLAVNTNKPRTAISQLGFVPQRSAVQKSIAGFSRPYPPFRTKALPCVSRRHTIQIVSTSRCFKRVRRIPAANFVAQIAL